jgi:hypothetical protein
MRARWPLTFGEPQHRGVLESLLKRQIKEKAKNEGIALYRVEPHHGREPGIADFLGAHRTWPIALEIKRPDKRMRIQDQQRKFAHEWVLRGGGVYIVANVVPDVVGVVLDRAIGEMGNT